MYDSSPQLNGNSKRHITEREVYHLSFSKRITYKVERHSSNGSAKPHYFSGCHATQYQDRRDSLYTANITLRDASGVFLQRFGPPTQYAAQAMKEEAAVGNDLLTNLTKHTICNSKSKTSDRSASARSSRAAKRLAAPALVTTSQRVAKPARPWQEAAENRTLEPTLDLPELLPTVHKKSMPIQTLREDPQHAHIFKRLHLGVWHDQAYQRLQLTADTLQNNGTNTAREAVGKFSEWLQRYTTKHVSLLVAGNQIETGLCDEFAAILHQRESIHYPWASPLDITLTWLTLPSQSFSTLASTLYSSFLITISSWNFSR
ncbi:uncharacterized protein UDID_11936 [Ustilago sp. UG-2017a]|nr:uncharacterized protein UDID_11936 [Ustilago sp. UG-2017a]